MPVELEIWLGDERIGSTLACERRWDLAEAGIGRGHQAYYFTSPTPLAIDALANLRVCRAADGADLPMAPACEALIAGVRRRERASQLSIARARGALMLTAEGIVGLGDAQGNKVKTGARERA
jgi:hypothetical protein